MIGIYRIRNIENGNCYYGSSKEIEKRWEKHLRELNNNKHINIVLQRAWNKYGKEKFIFEVIEEMCVFDKEKILKLEQEYLNQNPEYNIGKISSGGDNLTNNPNKQQIIRKIKTSIQKKMDALTKEEKREKFARPLSKNPNWNGGKTFCVCGERKSYKAKTCTKCRDRYGKNNSFYGKSHSDESKKAIAKNKEGKYCGKQNIPIIIDGIKYNSAGEASKMLNIPMITIRWRVLSKNKKFNNYKYA